MAFPLLIAIGGMMGASALSLATFGPGTGDLITKFLNETFQAKYYSASELLRMWAKGTVTTEELSELMKGAGFEPAKTKNLQDSYTEILNNTEILTMWYRYRNDAGNVYEVNEDWLKQRMLQAGIEPDNSTEYTEANRPVPTLQDIIRFAVRDVYEPEQVALAGLSEDLPDEYLLEADKRGLNRDDAEKFWQAHWSLPGISQAYSMFQRLYVGADMGAVFTEKDMDVFFKLVDIAPGFRDQLKAISFRPVGRVDIRRFWRVGVYKKYPDPFARMVRDYRQLGYKPSDAQDMADFTVLLAGEGRKKLTVSQILKFYNEDLFETDRTKEATELLKGWGFSSETAALLLAHEDKKFLDAEETAKLSTIQDEYVSGIIKTEPELRTALAAIPLLQSRVEKEFKGITKKRETSASRLTRSELERLYRNKFIDRDRFTNGLIQLGYLKPDIDLLLKLYNTENTEATKLPSKEDVSGWLTEELISQTRFVEYMKQIGFDDTFISLYLQSVVPEPDKDALKNLVVKEDKDNA